jgi:hypothetical protein
MGVLHIILKVSHPKIISTQISEQKILKRLQAPGHNVVWSSPRHERDSTNYFKVVVIGTGCCKSNYHTITTTIFYFYLLSVLDVIFIS